MYLLLLFLFINFINPSYAITLPSQSLKAYDCTHCDTLSHIPLSTSWPIHNKLFKPQSNKQISKKYHFEVTAAQLFKGIPIYTTAPKAIIRIVPMNKKIILKDSQFRLAKGSKINLPLSEVSTLSPYHSEDLPAINLAKIIELKPELGSGQFTLSLLDFNYLATERFQIRIFDKASTAGLLVETNQAYYQYGDELTTTIFLKKAAKRYSANNVKANLLSPDGQSVPIPLTEVEPGLYRGKIILDNEKNFPGQNWYIETDTSAKVDNQIINRHAHTAFSYAIPSALISEITRLNSNKLTFNAAINVATGSRYMLQAVLFKADVQGKKHAIEIAQAADWLAPGNANLTFSFKHKIDKLEQSPYYLGSIQLIDYGQLKPVFEHNLPIDIANLG
ncbi:DUF4785 domain-containing protein [Legionella sp. D16C41]|uniref:DUF4785 domain-containing protein n=1 Tax=Legionella sp. D16C41 TaxID=3402688 RepID=UPI003AF75796